MSTPFGVTFAPLPPDSAALARPTPRSIACFGTSLYADRSLAEAAATDLDIDQGGFPCVERALQGGG